MKEMKEKWKTFNEYASVIYSLLFGKIEGDNKIDLVAM